jgi:hypothetical protein
MAKEMIMEIVLREKIGEKWLIGGMQELSGMIEMFFVITDM